MNASEQNVPESLQRYLSSGFPVAVVSEMQHVADSLKKPDLAENTIAGLYERMTFLLTLAEQRYSNNNTYGILTKKRATSMLRDARGIARTLNVEPDTQMLETFTAERNNRTEHALRNAPKPEHTSPNVKTKPSLEGYRAKEQELVAAREQINAELKSVRARIAALQQKK